MEKKEPRVSTLYVRIKKRNAAWMIAEMKRLKYKSKSEFVDKVCDGLRNKKSYDSRAK